MANSINVTPEKLRQTSGEFATIKGSVQAETNRMMSIVNELNGVIWTGEARTAYTSKFSGLQADMGKILTMIQEHVDDLQQIASEYERAESSGVQQAQSLKSNVLG